MSLQATTIEALTARLSMCTSKTDLNKTKLNLIHYEKNRILGHDYSLLVIRQTSRNCRMTA